MKKIVTTLALLSLCCSISAQDTILFGDSNYMYPYPTYSGFLNTYADNYHESGITSRIGTAFFGEGITDLPIYGVGVMLPSLGVTEAPYGYNQHSNLYDIDIDNEYRSVGVCKLFGHTDTAGLEFWYVDFLDTLRYENLCRKHIVTMQAQYGPNLQPCLQDIHYVMYDYRLDSPIMINNDTLVLYSHTDRMNAFSSIILYAYNEYDRNHFYSIGRIDDMTTGPSMDTAMSQYYSIEVLGWSYYNNTTGLYVNSFPGIFPILQPIIDTADQRSGDTTAVDGVDGVGRYVSLTPNPAEDRVQVLSSFGLNRVEAYNAEGRLVYTDEAHGLSKTIDVTAWPRGLYVVRVITPMGQTTKKLVLK